MSLYRANSAEIINERVTRKQAFGLLISCVGVPIPLDTNMDFCENTY
jgi:hypothetical protein